MVLILKDTGSNFEITHIYIIQSYGSVNDASCRISGDQPSSFIVCISPVDTSKDINGGIDSASPDSAVIYAIISIYIIILCRL